jgi:hypothetical protein
MVRLLLHPSAAGILHAEHVGLRWRKLYSKGRYSALHPIPDSYQGLPMSKLDASVLDLAHLYAAFAKGGDNGSYDAPTFTDAVRLHRLISSRTRHLPVISKPLPTGSALKV